MSKIDEILTKVDHKAGYKVPEGYFADFTSKMMEALPEKKIEEHRKPTRWMRIRPFVYMAAMFGGVDKRCNQVIGRHSLVGHG